MKDPKKKKSPVKKAFGIKVKIKRYENELTQEQLATKSKMHWTYIGGVERGERNISLENIVALARALKCSPKDLMPE
jgi:transcriptional regulator with XRE-family HTH domain